MLLLVQISADKCALLVYISCVLFSTYHVFLAAEDFLPSRKDPIKYPSTFSLLLNRGSDNSDTEWFGIKSLLFGSSYLILQICYCIGSIIALKFSYREIWVSMSPIFTLGTCILFVGTRPAFILFSIPITFLGILKFKSKLICWLTSGFVLIVMEKSDMSFGEGVQIEYWQSLYVSWTMGWIILRCISFSLDTINNSEFNGNLSLKDLNSIMRYVFYFPLSTFGPIVDYERFERSLKSSGHQISFSNFQWLYFVGRIFKQILRICLLELLLHYLYFTPLTNNNYILKRVNCFALFGIIFWIVQYWWVKFGIIFEFGSILSSVDFIETDRVLVCPARVNSVAFSWRKCDVGLYKFLLKYIYIPGIKYGDAAYPKASQIIKEIVCSALSFGFVGIYHGNDLQTFIWTTLSFGTLLLEKIVVKFIKVSTTQEGLILKLLEILVLSPFSFLFYINNVLFIAGLPRTIRICQTLFGLDLQEYMILHTFFILHTLVGVQLQRKSVVKEKDSAKQA